MRDAVLGVVIAWRAGSRELFASLRASDREARGAPDRVFDPLPIASAAQRRADARLSRRSTREPARGSFAGVASRSGCCNQLPGKQEVSHGKAHFSRVDRS